MRRALAAVLAVLLFAAFARAQEEKPPAPADSATLTALDYTEMLEGWDGKGDAPASVPLRDRAVRVFGGGDAANALEVRTDAEGNFTLPLATIETGKRIRLLALGADRKATHVVAPPFDPRVHQTGPIAFFRLAKDSPLVAALLIQNVVVVQAPGNAKPGIRTNLIAQIQNESYEYWLGDARAGMETLRLPVLRGLQVVAVMRGDETLTYKLDESGTGAAEVVISGADFAPTFDGRPEVIRVVATGPFVEGAEYDFSFTAKLPIVDFRLHLEETRFSFVSGGSESLKDGGANPAKDGIMTRAWVASEVPPGTRIDAKFVQGTEVHPRVWKTVGILALTLIGAVLLGKALASRGPKAEVRADVPVEDAAEQVRELQKRHARGEITDFELRARKAALTGAAQAAAAPARPGELMDVIAQIEARSVDASPEQLRHDIRALAALLRKAIRD